MSEYAVPSYFYPINSGLFIEDHLGEDQMIIMNDRPQSGSAYSNGRIELMINRYGLTIDGLGVWEPLREVDLLGKGFNVSANFIFSF